jgi:hypothetical protein
VRVVVPKNCIDIFRLTSIRCCFGPSAWLTAGIM